MTLLTANAWADSSVPNVDLSLGVNITPSEFYISGRQTIDLTVYNAGSDAAGTIPGTSESIYIIEDAFYIDESTPPPFEVVAPISGCYIDRYITEPLPDNRIALLFIFNFESIPAGGSRTCTYDIVYYPQTRNSFASGWTVYTVNDMDTDPANDYLPNVFQAAPVSVPTASGGALAALGLLLGTASFSWSRARARSQSSGVRSMESAGRYKGELAIRAVMALLLSLFVVQGAHAKGHSASSGPKAQYVSSYDKADGTHVDGYWRAPGQRSVSGNGTGAVLPP